MPDIKPFGVIDTSSPPFDHRLGEQLNAAVKVERSVSTLTRLARFMRWFLSGGDDAKKIFVPTPGKLIYDGIRGHHYFLDEVVKDNRYREYLSLVQHIETWNEFADSLNRLILKIEHHQIPEVHVSRAMVMLESVRADEERLRHRIAYCVAIAREGALGTRTARVELGTGMVIDQSDLLLQLRDHIEQVRDLDARALANLEVAALERRH